MENIKCYYCHPTIEPYLYTEGLNVIGTICSSCEVGKIELNLVPAIVQTHGHRTNERLYTGRALVVRGSESPSYILVV